MLSCVLGPPEHKAVGSGPILVEIRVSIKPFELESLLVMLADHIDDFLHGHPLSTKPLSGQHMAHCEITVAVDGD